MERGPNNLERIILQQKSCIEKQQLMIDELEKKVTILTEELQANQLEITKLLKRR
jgi:hypothetical protein